MEMGWMDGILNVTINPGEDEPEEENMLENVIGMRIQAIVFATGKTTPDWFGLHTYHTWPFGKPLGTSESSKIIPWNEPFCHFMTPLHQVTDL